MSRLLMFAAFLSGFSGLAYEVLYGRLLGAYFSSMFYVAVFVIFLFFIGIALGSRLAPRFPKVLVLAEFIIGIWAILVAILFAKYGLSLAVLVATWPLGTEVNLLTITFLLVGLPAVAIGFSIPLFTSYLHHNGVKGAFLLSYGLYNLGAAIALLVLEYVVIRHFGFTISLIMFGVINLSVAFLVFISRPSNTVAKWFALERIDQYALFAFSLGSGVLQALLFSMYGFVIGPLNGNFALVISATLFGLVAGSYLVKKFDWSFNKIVALSTGVLVIVFCIFPYLIIAYGWFATWLWSVGLMTYLTRFALTFAFLLALIVPLYAVIGGSVPAMIKDKGLKFTSSALVVASLGNAFGYLVFVFVLHEVLAAPFVVILVAITFVGVLLLRKRACLSLFVSWPAVLVAVAVPVMFINWPYGLGGYTFWEITRLDQKILSNQISYKHFNTEVTLTEDQEGALRLVHRGNESLYLHPQKKNALRQSLKGVLGSYYSTGHDKALIIGLGSGIPPSAAADVFGQVDVVEIYPPMEKVALYFSSYNDNFYSKKNVDVSFVDGLTALATGEEKYDYIYNAVSSPKYYTSGKLWTKDYFELAKTRLAPGGVVGGWIYTGFSINGFLVMQNTLESVFENCIFHILENSGVAFICSDDQLVISSPNHYVEGLFIDELAKHGWQGTTLEFISGLAFKPEPSSAESVNTIDRPILDYYSFPEIRGWDSLDVEAEFFRNYVGPVALDSKTGERRQNADYCQAIDFIYDNKGQLPYVCGSDQ